MQNEIFEIYREEFFIGKYMEILSVGIPKEYNLEINLKQEEKIDIEKKSNNYNLVMKLQKIAFGRGIYSYNIILDTEFSKNLKEVISSDYEGIYIVENSKYLNWFNQETRNIFIDQNIIHYMILGKNGVVDVLSNVEPFLIDDKGI